METKKIDRESGKVVLYLARARERGDWLELGNLRIVFREREKSDAGEENGEAFWLDAYQHRWLWFGIGWNLDWGFVSYL